MRKHDEINAFTEPVSTFSHKNSKMPIIMFNWVVQMTSTDWDPPSFKVFVAVFRSLVYHSGDTHTHERSGNIKTTKQLRAFQRIVASPSQLTLSCALTGCAVDRPMCDQTSRDPCRQLRRRCLMTSAHKHAQRSFLPRLCSIGGRKGAWPVNMCDTDPWKYVEQGDVEIQWNQITQVHLENVPLNQRL